MTRFARAKGSKSSNERVPESATSWRDMKSDLVRKNEETGQVGESKDTPKSNLISQLLEKVIKWSDFPYDDQQLKNQTKSNKAETSEKPKLVLAVQKKKKRKRQANNSECSEKTLEIQSSIEESEKPLAGKNKKKAHKKVRLDDGSESIVDASKTISSDTNSKGQRGNFSATTNVKPGEKKSLKKIRDNGEHKKRKSEVTKIYINGNEVELSYYDGFPIKKIDAERLTELRKEMISRGLPHSEIKSALRRERKRAEKTLSREKKKVCYNCRRSGHVLSDCPALKSGSDAQLSETGICWKCGSTEHTHSECKVTRGDDFKFAQCFICQEQGHIARQCPDNKKGLYPKGGACRVCGDVTHLQKDCPKYQFEQEENRIMVDTIDAHNIESLEIENKKVGGKKERNLQKIVKF